MYQQEMCVDVSILAAEYKKELRALTDRHGMLVQQMVNNWNTLSTGQYAALNNEIQDVRARIMSLSANDVFGA